MSVSLVGTLIGHFPSCMGGFISLSVCATKGSGPLTMVAGPIVGEAIGGPEDSCLCTYDVVLGISNPGGPPLDAPCQSMVREAQEKKKSVFTNFSTKIFKF